MGCIIVWLMQVANEQMHMTTIGPQGNGEAALALAFIRARKC